MYFSCPAVTPSCSSPIVLLRQGPFPLHTPSLALQPLQATPPPASRNFWTCPGTFESRIPHSRSPAPIVTSRRLAALQLRPPQYVLVIGNGTDGAVALCNCCLSPQDGVSTLLDGHAIRCYLVPKYGLAWTSTYCTSTYMVGKAFVAFIKGASCAEQPLEPVTICVNACASYV
ncbi:hypothetical protein CI102_11626 [Trichoderma harzianum]|nr:hypothetical protein CI102_11626 [Trichoderma harzianum]